MIAWIICMILVGLFIFGCIELDRHTQFFDECIKSHQELRQFSGRMMIHTIDVCDQYKQVPNPNYTNGTL